MDEMDFDSLSEDEVQILGAIAFPGLPVTIDPEVDREAICKGLVDKGFLVMMESWAGKTSYRMSVRVHVDYCQWCADMEDEG